MPDYLADLEGKMSNFLSTNNKPPSSGYTRSLALFPSLEDRIWLTLGTVYKEMNVQEEVMGIYCTIELVTKEMFPPSGPWRGGEGKYTVISRLDGYNAVSCI